MSRQGSNDFLDLVDVGDLLDTLGDEVDAAVAAALVASPSFDDVEKEQDVSQSKGETEAASHGADAVAVTQEQEEPQKEEQEEEQRQGDHKGEAEEEQAPSGRSAPRPLDVDIDSTPLSVQHGYECFRKLEKLREEQKKQLQIEEEEEKGKPSYTGKKWVVTHLAGPLRPQEAGQLKVACAVKAGGEKMSPRQEIEKLTQEEAERKKKEKELAAAAAAGPSHVPIKPSLNSGTAKDEETAKEGDTAKEADGAKEGEAEKDTAGEENKEGEAEATAATGADLDEDKGEEKRGGDSKEENTCETANLEKRPSGLQDAESTTRPALTAGVHESPQDEKHEDADAARKANASKFKKKAFPVFSCFTKKGLVREPHKPPGKKGSTTAEHVEASSTGQLSETLHVEHKGLRTVPPFAEPVFDE